MSEEILYCPSCSRKVRVPEEQLGQTVQCPLCGTVFTAPTRGPGPRPSSPPVAGDYGTARPLAVHRQPDDWDDDVSLRARARAAVLPPAICLMIAAIVGAMADLFSLVTVIIDQEGFVELFTRFSFGPPPPKEQIITGLIVGFAFFVLVSLAILVAAIQMIRLRTYWLALTGSALAMINFANVCCLLSLPFGIWSLVVLLRPEVRKAFR